MQHEHTNNVAPSPLYIPKNPSSLQMVLKACDIPL